MLCLLNELATVQQSSKQGVHPRIDGRPIRIDAVASCLPCKRLQVFWVVPLVGHIGPVPLFEAITLSFPWLLTGGRERSTCPNTFS